MTAASGLILLDVVGLTPDLLGDQTPRLCDLAAGGSLSPIECPFPALTLSSQASLLTGKRPAEHGIVGNGWWWPELNKAWLWRQPHALLQAEDLPSRLKREHPRLKVARLFWWFSLFAPSDWWVMPEPLYRADGLKIPDIHTHPPELRDELTRRFGPFPLFHFWGPAADIKSSRWIAKASLHLIRKERPDLSLVYLPHLDYDFQRFGPDHPRSREALQQVDRLVGQFSDLSEELHLNLAVISEYGIRPVSRPVHLNRILRKEGFFQSRLELGLERPDLGASRAFAVADHQIAHVYVRDPGDRAAVAEILRTTSGVEQVLMDESREAAGLAHPRSGDLVAVAEPDAWFTWYFWLDDALAPDYARTVDIHRKPGYDPAELFLDQKLCFPRLRIARKLLARRLGFRNLLDVIGLDSSLVKGSHGRLPEDPSLGPLLISSQPHKALESPDPLPLRRLPGLLEELMGPAGSLPRG